MMPIDKISSAEYYSVGQRNIVRPKRATQQIPQDTISLTSTARQNAGLLRAREVAMSASDMRSNRLAELRVKLRSPSYPDQMVINRMVERLLDHWNV